MHGKEKDKLPRAITVISPISLESPPTAFAVRCGARSWGLSHLAGGRLLPGIGT